MYTITGFYQLDGVSYLINYDKELISLEELQMAGSIFNINNNDFSCIIEYGNLRWKFEIKAFSNY